MEAWILNIMQQLGYLGIALLMFLDNIFPPIPSEIIMPSAGYTASQGELILLGVILSGSAGSIVAALILYWLGRKIPQPKLFALVENYGKYLSIKAQDVEKALCWFEQYGHYVVFFGRMIPAVRSLISIPAGMSRMHFGKFVFFTSLGTLIWTGFLAYIGFYFGENKALMHSLINRIGWILLVFLVIYIVYKLFHKLKK